jgi:peptidoglycan/LPS O-acetylase OafA/YrhL
VTAAAVSGTSFEPEKPRELPALTPLRGLAALTVLLYHAGIVSTGHPGAAPPGLFRRGYLAVDLFFLLSGFVLAHVYGRRLAEDRSRAALAKFLWARFCRIYPTSLFAATVFVLCLGRFEFPTWSALETQLVPSLFLTQIPWLDRVVLNPPSWSISAELYAYLLFPLLVPIVFRLSVRAALTLGAILLIGVAANGTFLDHEQQVGGWRALLRAVPEFTVGVFAYRAYSEGVLRTVCRSDTTLLGVVALIFAACAARLSDGPIVVLLLALLMAAVSNNGRAKRLLNIRPLRWLGDVSYSLYIFQALPLSLMLILSGVLAAHGIVGFRLQALAVLLALGSGVLVHRCVDVPVRATLRRLPDRVIALTVPYRRAEMRLVTAASPPEHDR